MLKHVFIVIVLVLIEGSSSRINLRCNNDFDRNMTCEFTPEQSTICSEYSLKVEFNPDEPNLKRDYNCAPSSDDRGKCCCSIDVEAGFLYGEDSIVTLRRNGNISTYFIDTFKNIKLKTPTIKSVNTTADGNSIVSWRTHYISGHTLSKDFRTELEFRSKKAGWNVTEEAILKTHYELNNLLPNTEYFVRVRVKAVIIDKSHSTDFSDWSEEFAFVSGNVANVPKIVVPVICLILIFIICTLVCCCVKIKKSGKDDKKDRIASFSPKIDGFMDYLIGAEHKILYPENTLPSRMEVFIPKQHITEEEKSITSISVGSSGNSNLIESTNSNSTSVDYGFVEKDPHQILERLRSAVQQDLERVRQARSAPVTNLLVLPSLSDYQSVGVQESERSRNPCVGSQSNPGCTSGSSFDNRCYSVPTSPAPCQSSFFTPSLCCDLGYQSSESFGQPLLMETEGCHVVLPPLIQTDLAYRPCDGCSIGEAECLPRSENVEASGSLVKPMGQGVSICMDRTLQGIEEEEQNCAQRSVCTKSLLQPCPLPLGECGPLLCSDEYRPVPIFIPS
ncbi:uncharacterized protein LOC134077407 [Sardina pilchardus]|uniref:uncharacterized protein LOC134077407 n=1 Tax=Sardina pilchardus TaxID=27697 RepID=UPI002E15ABA6